MTKIAKNLEIVLASTYSLYLKTQNYHWNVTGPNFKALHELFALQYEEMILAIDILAERIRTFGHKVDGTYSNFAKISLVKEANKDLKSEDMVKDLVLSNKILIDLLKEGVHTAQQEHDEASADILIGRIEVHEKNVWMLQSSL